MFDFLRDIPEKIEEMWEIIEKIPQKLEQLLQKIEQISQSIQKILDVFEKISSFFSTISNFLPEYFFLIFFISLFFLFLLNNFLPQTPKFNFTLSVCLTSIILLIFQVSFWKIFKVASILIFPFYFLGFFFHFIKSFFENLYYKSKNKNIEDIEDCILSLQSNQRELLREFYKESQRENIDKKVLLDKISFVKSNLDNLEELLRK